MSKKYVYLDLNPTEARRRVSARVPESLYEQFIDAQREVNKHGLELSISKVLEVAMESACEEAERFYGPRETKKGT